MGAAGGPTDSRGFMNFGGDPNTYDFMGVRLFTKTVTRTDHNQNLRKLALTRAEGEKILQCLNPTMGQMDILRSGESCVSIPVIDEQTGSQYNWGLRGVKTFYALEGTNSFFKDRNKNTNNFPVGGEINFGWQSGALRISL
ncbi:hypothetical protein SLE2022_225490 [Rubroshorea leprosula]